MQFAHIREEIVGMEQSQKSNYDGKMYFIQNKQESIERKICLSKD